MQVVPITSTGNAQLKEKLAKLKEEFAKLPAIIKEAREKGDLKENAEYHAAREKQGMLQAQINQVSSFLTGAKIIDPHQLPSDVVTFGKRVSVKNTEDASIHHYVIVGPGEASFYDDGLSIHSDLAKAILGKKKGDQTTVNTPAGTFTYEIQSLTVM